MHRFFAIIKQNVYLYGPRNLKVCVLHALYVIKQ